MRKELFLLLTAFLWQSCNSPDENFANRVFLKYYGKDGNYTAADLMVNADGTFYILGTVELKNNNNRIYLAKADRNGNFISEKTYTLYRDRDGGVEESRCTARDMEVTGDGNLIILADVGEGPLRYYCQLLKIDPTSPDNVPMVTKRYSRKAKDGSNVIAISVNSITRIAGGNGLVPGYILCGSKTGESGMDASDVLQVYFDENLNEVSNFTTSYSQGLNDVAVKAFQYKDSHFVVFGYTNSPISDGSPTINYWVYLLDRYGVPGASNKISYGAEAAKDSNDEYATAVVRVGPESGGGFMMAGFTRPSGSRAATAYPYFVKLPEELSFQKSDIEFSSTLNEAGDDLLMEDFQENTPFDYLKKVSVCSSGTGGFYAVATRHTTNGDILLFKMDRNGKEVWKRVLGGENEDFAADVAEGSDGSVIVYGTITTGNHASRYRKIALFKLNSNGRLE